MSIQLTEDAVIMVQMPIYNASNQIIGMGIPVQVTLEDLIAALEGGALPQMTAADAETGTSEVPMLVSPKVLNDEIARQIALI